MAKKRTRACWLLLLVLLFMSSMVLSIGVTQARYQNTDTAVAVLESSQAGVSSNCMVTAQDAPRTVLLGELDPQGFLCVPFWMLSSGADAKGVLNWGVSNPEYADYLNVSVFAGYETLKANAELELLEDIRLDLLLCVEPTELARSTPHEAMSIFVHVTWGNEMWGTFRVSLPEVVDTLDSNESELVPETEEPTEPSETTEATEETETTESTEETEATEATEETETTESTEETETTEATEGTEATEPTEETEATEPTGETEPTEPTETTESTEPTEPTEDSSTAMLDLLGQEELVQLKTLGSFHPSELLPVLVELPEGITAIRLGEHTVNGDNTSFMAFPDYTMFSLDGGVSYYMLYGGYVPEFVLENVTSIPVLLDFGYVDLDESKEMVLAMEAYVEEELFKTCSATVAINEEQSGRPNLHNQSQLDPEPSEAMDIEDEINAQMLGPILTFDNQLEFAFPTEWEEAELEYSVELLTMAEDQTLKYVPVTLTEGGLHAVSISDEDMNKLVFRLGDQFTTPGTYRVNMTWTYKNVQFWSKQTTFFINYSVRMDDTVSGQEVPNDN